MNNLKINASIDSLSELTSTSTDTYPFTVKFFNSSDDPLDNPNIPNSYTTNVVTTVTSFNINVPITSGNYTIPDVTIKIYNSDDTSCCFASITQTITNTISDPDPEITLETSLYFSS